MNPQEQYAQLDWSPTTWALLQLGMVLVTVVVMAVTVTLAARASQATRPAAQVPEAPEGTAVEAGLSRSPARAA
jgi:heme/copper-type cytochrome/quinol oxidase subunit 2